MSIRITISDTVACKVAGVIADETGPQPFDFTLLAKRLNTEQLRQRLTDESGSMLEFIVGVATGWRGVKGEGGEVPFSEGALRELLLLPGLAQLTFDAYMASVGAKAKN
jgi:hypothetical protein